MIALQEMYINSADDKEYSFLGVFDSIENIPQEIQNRAKSSITNTIIKLNEYKARLEKYKDSCPMSYKECLMHYEQDKKYLLSKVNDDNCIFDLDNVEDSKLANWLTWNVQASIYFYHKIELNKLIY